MHVLFQFMPVSRLSPQVDGPTFAAGEAVKQMTPVQQAGLYDMLESTPGFERERSADLFQATWTGLGVGLVLGVAGLMVLQHLKGE